MTNKLYITGLLLMLTLHLSGQGIPYLIKDTLSISADYIRVDALGNLYMIENSKLTKYNVSDQSTNTYQNDYMGKITDVDVYNPLKILVYYSDFNQAVFLNKQLREISSSVSFDETGYFNVGAICSSVEGGLWIFDSQSERLLYLNQNFKQERSSLRVTGLLDIQPPPVFMCERNQKITLSFRNGKILILDSYGGYLSSFPLEIPASFQIINKNLVFYRKPHLIRYHLKNHSRTVLLDTKDQSIKDVKIKDDHIYLLTNAGKIIIGELILK